MKKEKKFFRNCKTCGKQVGHVSDKSRKMCEGRECASCGTTRSKTGTKHSAETKAKISASNTGRKNPPPSAETRAKRSAALKGRVFSAESKARMSASRKAYKKSVKDAYTKMWGEQYVFTPTYFAKWSLSVKERDNYTCQKCATVAAGCKINSHHIVPKAYFMARALDIDNGVTLCSSCHRKVHNELDKYTVAGERFTATDFINHYNGWKPNGSK